MPAKVLKTYAKESGKSMAECEKAWDEAKEQADHKFVDKPKDEHYWSYVNIVTQMKLGIKKKSKKAKHAK